MIELKLEPQVRVRERISAKYFAATRKELVNFPRDYPGEDRKKAVHTRLRRILKEFAKHYLGLDEVQFTVRTNMAGIAVGGETILHTDPLPGCSKGIYIKISPGDTTGLGHVYRTVKNRADYVGGSTNWASTPNVINLSEMAIKVKAMCI